MHNKNWGLYLLSSILFILSFPNFTGIESSFSWMAWFSLVPFIYAIDRENNVKDVVRNSLFYGLLIFLGGMYWLTEVTIIGYLGIVSYMSLYIVLFGVIRFYYKNFIINALAWTILEYIRGSFAGGIPWLLIGASQYKFIYIIQIANITGIYGVSFLVALVNSVVCEKKYKLIKTVFVLMILVTIGVYGNAKINKQDTGSELKIGIIQPNIPQEVKWDPDYSDWMIDRLINLSEKVGSCDLLVWPETAVPALAESKKTQNELVLMVRQLNCNLLVGSQGIDKENRYYNSAFFISEKKGIEKEYRKIHLVPFGEYVPFGKTFPFLKKCTPIEGEFYPGNEYVLFDVEVNNTKLYIGTLICFEDIFPSLARRFVSNGADILINITNDGWFGKTAGPYQHMILSIFRAVENKRPLIRSTNTGVSCFIDSSGRITDVIRDKNNNAILVTGSTSAYVRTVKKDTFYTKYGDIFIYMCISLFIILLLVPPFCIKAGLLYRKPNRYNLN